MDKFRYDFEIEQATHQIEALSSRLSSMQIKLMEAKRHKAALVKSQQDFLNSKAE